MMHTNFFSASPRERRLCVVSLRVTALRLAGMVYPVPTVQPVPDFTSCGQERELSSLNIWRIVDGVSPAEYSPSHRN